MRVYPGINLSAVTDRGSLEAFRIIDPVLRDMQKALAAVTPATGVAVSPPLAASYVTILNEAVLTAERKLVAAAPITLTDGGANGSVTIGAALATPSIALGTAALGGSAASLIRSDATIVAFDTNLPAVLATAAATGSVAFAARRDHVHIFPTALQSAANLKALTLTDTGTDQVLTGSLGGLTITPSNNLLTLGWFNAGGGTTAANTALMQFVGLTTVVGTTPTTAISGTLNWNAAATYSGITMTGINAGVTHGATPVFTNVILRAMDITNTINTQSANAGQTWTEKTGLNITNNAAAQSGVGTLTVTDTFGIKVTMGTSLGTPGSFTNAYGARIPIPNFGGTIRRGIYVLPSTTNFGTEADSVEGVFVDTVARGLTTRRSLAAVGATLGTPTDVVILDQTTAHGIGTNQYFLRGLNRSRLSNPSGRGDTVLELRQLNVGATAGAHLNLDDKAGDPPSPVAGDAWRSGDSLKVYLGTRAARATLEQRTTEQDFGATPINYGSWSVSDADVSVGSHIQTWLTGEPTAGGNDGDEGEMEPMACYAESIGAGVFTLVAVPFDGPVVGIYKFGYQVA